MITKKCDQCKGDIEFKGNRDYQFSQWCLFHYKKRRDFCSDKCLVKWMDEYFKDKENQKLFEEVSQKIIICDEEDGRDNGN